MDIVERAMSPSVLGLLCSLVLQSPAPTTKRVGVVLVPMDREAEAQIPRLEAYVTEALEQVPSLVVKKADDLLGLPVDEEAEAALKRAEAGYTEGRAAYEARQWEDAERKLKSVIKEFYRAAAALKGCGHLCDALALYAASLHQRGDAEEAKLEILDLIALNPAFEFEPKRFPKEFLPLRTQVATGHEAAMRGSLNIKTKPAGVRVFMDGEQVGYSPMTVGTLPIGKHVVRFERPGFQVLGKVIDVTPEETEVPIELKPTPAFKAYDAQLDRVAGDVVHDKGNAAIMSLGKSLGLDRGLVGTVKITNESGAMDIQIGLYDIKDGHRLAGKKTSFQGDEFGQLKSEVARMVGALIMGADGPHERVSKTADPLDSHHGTEEWNADDAARRKKSGRDPLDNMSGTEDW